MSTQTLSILSLSVAIVALGFAITSSDPIPSVKKESAYERVMRTRTLHCGYLPWPVTEEIDPNTKQLKGTIPELTEAMGQKLGIKIEWTEEAVWGQQAEALKTGKIDAICSTDGPWNYTEASVVDFSEPMAFFPIYLYGRQDEQTFHNLETANNPNMIFSGIDGDISMAMAQDRFPKAKHINLPGSDDPSLIMVNVATKKADLVITDALTIDHFNKNNAQKLKPLYEKPVAVINMSFSVAKGEHGLLQMLNQGFQLLQSLGTSDEILDKYDPEHKLFYRPAKRWAVN